MLKILFNSVDEEYLYVGGGDIKIGDVFCFYVFDLKFVMLSCIVILEKFRDVGYKEIVGGFIFFCCGRGLVFFEKFNVDSFFVLDNFFCVVFFGMFCGGEIGWGF